MTPKPLEKDGNGILIRIGKPVSVPVLLEPAEHLIVDEGIQVVVQEELGDSFQDGHLGIVSHSSDHVGVESSLELLLQISPDLVAALLGDVAPVQGIHPVHLILLDIIGLALLPYQAAFFVPSNPAYELSKNHRSPNYDLDIVGAPVRVARHTGCI